MDSGSQRPSDTGPRPLPPTQTDRPIPDAAAQPHWTSEELFGQSKEILISHGGDIYRLRQTRNGKLILNK